MNSDTDNIQLEQNIKEVMKDLPAPIRRYLATGEYSKVAAGLAHKYALHIDQAGVLESNILMLLMGLKGPEEFEATLKNEGSIAQATVGAIMSDLNQEVFAPLRKEMQESEASGAAPVERRPAAAAPNYAPPVERAAPQTPMQAAPLQASPQQVSNPPRAAVPPVSPEPKPSVSFNTAAPQRENLAAAQPQPPSTVPPVRTFASDAAAMGHAEDALPTPPVPAAAQTPRVTQPRELEPQPPRPGQSGSVPFPPRGAVQQQTPRTMPVERVVQPPPPNQAPPPAPPPPKNLPGVLERTPNPPAPETGSAYPADPYREPIE